MGGEIAKTYWNMKIVFQQIVTDVLGFDSKVWWMHRCFTVIRIQEFIFWYFLWSYDLTILDDKRNLILWWFKFIQFIFICISKSIRCILIVNDTWLYLYFYKTNTCYAIRWTSQIFYSYTVTNFLLSFSFFYSHNLTIFGEYLC